METAFSDYLLDHLFLWASALSQRSRRILFIEILINGIYLVVVARTYLDNDFLCTAFAFSKLPMT